MTLPDFVVPTYIQMLGALSQWLSKAETQRPDGSVDALLAARPAPDMFPLFPPALETLLDEGRNAGERPGTLADAQARIVETIAVVESAAATGIIPKPTAPIAHALPNGMILDLTAEQYARDWALPQFYFHVVTAYSIIRAQGIELGKADYASHMFAYLRQNTLS
jgi:hypothetical protein